MTTPIIYYGNGLLSGTLTLDGSPGDTAAVVPRVRDGSVNTSYAITNSGAGTRTGEINLSLTTSATHAALVFPRCGLSSGVRIRCYSRPASGVGAGGGALEQVNEATTADTTFYLKELAYPTSGDMWWEVWVTAYAGQTGKQYVHEVMLAQKYTFPRSPEVEVSRNWVRQFTRTAVPGSEPYTRRDGPMLRQTAMNFTVLSGSEVSGLRSVIEELEGGDAFVLTDDLGDSYWAELLEANVTEQDTAGVARVQLTFQEIKVE